MPFTDAALEQRHMKIASFDQVEALKSGIITKPVVAWVSGTCAQLFRSEVQFGHAGARSGGAQESAQVRQRRFSSH
jgi:ATP citrate (pro-S)-lyase